MSDNREGTKICGVAQETFFFENMECSEDPYAYNSCSKLGIDTCSNPSFASYLATSRKFTERQENNFVFANPNCRNTCVDTCSESPGMSHIGQTVW